MVLGTYDAVPDNFTLFMLHHARHSTIGEPVQLPKMKHMFQIEVSGIFDMAKLFFQIRCYTLSFPKNQLFCNYTRSWQYISKSALTAPTSFKLTVREEVDQVRAILRNASEKTDVSVVITL